MTNRNTALSAFLLLFVLASLIFNQGCSTQNDHGEKPSHLQRYKHDQLILKPTGEDDDFDSGMVDCFKVIMEYRGDSGDPYLFQKDGYYYAVYTGYDREKMMRSEGRYQLGLARSSDLVHWERLGKILATGDDGKFDAGSVGAGIAIHWDNKFYMFYTGFASEGYEQGAGKTGLAVSTDLQSWERKGVVMEPDTVYQWESAGLYQVYPMRHQDTFYLFYNAKNKKSNWREQIGVATSQDLVHWEKYAGNPIVKTGGEGSWDSRFVADPWVIPIQGDWHMFYYGFDGTYAREGLATSPDLFHWEKSQWNPILSEGKEGTFDAKYTHKPCVIEKDGVYYHYYTAVGSQGRCIALATSQPLNKK